MNERIEAKIRDAMVDGLITTAGINKACESELREMVSGSVNMQSALFVFWRIVGRAFKPHEAFRNPTRMPLAVWEEREDEGS